MAAAESGVMGASSVQAVWQRLNPAWLGSDRSRTAAWTGQVGDRRRQLENYSSAPSFHPLVLIVEADPVDFLAGFWAALLAGWDVAIANPQWGQQEWQSVSQTICPAVIWGDGIQWPQQPVSRSQTNYQASSDTEPAILVPTGGSSGQVKFVAHRWRSLIAAADGFCQFFRPAGEPVNVYCVLPIYHVSGLMQVLRAWASGGEAVIAPFKPLLRSQIDDGKGRFISLVPTQLERLIQAGKGTWLQSFQAVLLGGAPPWPTLLDRAAGLHIPLCLSYGMTETAAMVTALSPQDFLRGDRSSGRALPHATIQIARQTARQIARQGGQTAHNAQPLLPGELGQIVVHIAALPEPVYTDDLGYLSDDGHLHITGRASHKIISGGENIFPAEVEAALRRTGQVKDVCVVGLPHSEWGEAVTAIYVPASAAVCAESLRQALLKPDSAGIVPALSRYKLPKHWVQLPALPRNAQGKLNRLDLLARLQRLSSQPAQASGHDDDGREY